MESGAEKYQEPMILVGHEEREYELHFDALRRRLWLNADDGSAVARFNVLTGVDLHTTASEQYAGAPECLWCTHEKPDRAVWVKFIDAVKHRYGVNLSEDMIDVANLA